MTSIRLNSKYWKKKNRDMKFLKENWKLLVILALAIFLRFYKLSTIPIGFNDDEAAFGYNAYSIMKSGYDEWGRLLPFPAFESFGDWKLVFYLYLTVASQFIFGATEFATRFPSALFGVLAIFASYLLAGKLFNKNVGLLSAFLLSISPWHVIASRNAFESDILIFSITIATYLFLLGLKKGKFMIFSLAIFLISFYIYRSSWLFVPLFLASLVLLHKNRLKTLKINLLTQLVVVIIFTAPLVPAVLNFSGQSRFLQESFIFGVAKRGITNEINEKRGDCRQNLQRAVCIIFYNKFLSYITVYFNNYFENLSPSTYFTKATAGGYQSFVNRGLFYSFELPFLVLGIFYLVITKNPAAKILIPWLLLAPVGASFTQIGNPGRLNILMPAPQIITAFGILTVVALIKQVHLKKIIAAGVIIVICVSLARFLLDLFAQSPQIAGRAQRYGYKELFNYLESQKGNYYEIAVSRQGDDAKQYIHYLFFTKPDPEIFFDPEISTRYRGGDGWQVVEKIGKVHFYEQTPKIVELPPATLLAVSANELSTLQEPIFTAKYLNGDSAFEVYDVDQLKKALEVQKND
ncbi:glycosyltransferase family 39 protein [Candidatus Woesebacteria bacterium]|nr:glycosyltransferase family 39 protein [Candidatus Woesebacteria bacterium]